MAWLRLRVTTAGEHAEAAEARFREAGAAAVSLHPADAAEAVLEPAPGTSPLWERVRIEGLFPVDADVRALTGLGVEVDFVADRDWSETWRRGLKPQRFGNLLVLPKEWPAPSPCDGTATIRLDPGLAFGTGTHPTTALCLDWLGRTPLAGKRVLDVGCGSGILGIAAARLGAASVTAVDHDPQARQATRANAADNGVDLKVADDLADIRGCFDIAVANIVANTLRDMAPRLAGIASIVVLSGVLTDQVATVAAAYPNVRFDPTETADGWAMLVGETRDG